MKRRHATSYELVSNTTKLKLLDSLLQEDPELLGFSLFQISSLELGRDRAAVGEERIVCSIQTLLIVKDIPSLLKLKESYATFKSDQSALKEESYVIIRPISIVCLDPTIISYV